MGSLSGCMAALLYEIKWIDLLAVGLISHMRQSIIYMTHKIIGRNNHSFALRHQEKKVDNATWDEREVKDLLVESVMINNENNTTHLTIPSHLKQYLFCRYTKPQPTATTSPHPSWRRCHRFAMGQVSLPNKLTGWTSPHRSGPRSNRSAMGYSSRL